MKIVSFDKGYIVTIEPPENQYTGFANSLYDFKKDWLNRLSEEFEETIKEKFKDENNGNRT